MPTPTFYYQQRADLATQLRADLQSMRGIVSSVLIGLLLLLAGTRLLPVESTPLTAKVLCLLSLTIATAGIGAYAGRRITGWLPMIGLLILSIIGLMIVRAAGDGLLAIGLLTGWGFLPGMMLGPLVGLAIAEQGPGIVLQSLTGTTAVMLLAGAFTTLTGFDASSLAPFLMVGVIGLNLCLLLANGQPALLGDRDARLLRLLSLPLLPPRAQREYLGAGDRSDDQPLPHLRQLLRFSPAVSAQHPASVSAQHERPSGFLPDGRTSPTRDCRRPIGLGRRA